MSSQRGQSLDNLLSETNDLKERMRQVLPSYIGLLKGVSSLPDEFERHFWVSCVEALLQTVKTDYQSFQTKAQQVDFLGKFMMVGMNLVLKTGGMQPLAPPPSPQLGVTISSSGKIKPDWRDNPYREPKEIFVTYDEFMAIARRLKNKLLKGTIVPTSEAEIPKLLYSLALELPKNSPDD